MNGFFQFAETVITECKLSEFVKEFPGKTLDYKELDKPIVKNNETKETRGLTDEERAYYKDKLNYSDAQLDKLSIDGNGQLYLKTINEGKEGTEGENGVKYERRTVVVNGIEIEGVFPVFDSKFDTQLPDDRLQASDLKQENYCNEKLKDAVNGDTEFAKQFTPEQLEQIKNGDTPDGYTWHHNEESGKMQLVKTDDHQANRHTGGKAIWGGGSDNR
ncbi:MAG: HNH endonuclease [Eubacteriaceae bacterium]